MKCALQIDFIESLNYHSDTSLLLAKELQFRNFKIFYYTANQLFIKNNLVMARGRYVELINNSFEYKSPKIIQKLNDFNVVMMRQDPPFDMNYLTNTYLLELLSSKTLVINNPIAVRNWSEKLSIFKFPEFIPPTIVSSSFFELERFYSEHKNIIIKSLYGSGGRSVCKIENHTHFKEAVDEYLAEHNFIMAQKFFPEIVHGDKRVLIVNDKVLGAIKRVPQKGGYLANMVAGGEAEKTELTEREFKISKEIASRLKLENIFFAGLDLINEHLIEINVTSPTGCVAYNNLYNTNCEKSIIDEMITLMK